jgi:hypothetical protein
MNRVYFTIITVLLALLGATGWLLKSQYTTNATLRVENTVLVEAADRAAEASKRDRQVLVARQAEIASTTRKLAQAQRNLAEALQRNNSWSDTHVPDEVQKALRGP